MLRYKNYLQNEIIGEMKVRVYIMSIIENEAEKQRLYQFIIQNQV